ncbi:MAG: HAMP domain-containing histidine kinase [Acidimicrobiales bacterium]|nr:HAMP domain-containing histidine kinase [Acidimicrobiales bacterium]
MDGVMATGNQSTGPIRRWELAAGALPSWMGSIRFRLTLIYSVVLFGLAMLVVGAIYAGLARSLSDEQIYKTYPAVWVNEFGEIVAIGEKQIRDHAREIEHQANQRALETYRTYSFATLLGLFGASLGVGWVVSGRVLRPIGHITAVAREIQATDLGRRIRLDGPPDELKDLADTFDEMLDRIQEGFDEQRRFIHEASHELRNPLAVMRTNLEVTLADPAAPPEELRHTLEVCERSTDRMTRLVDDLLLYARRGSTARVTEPVDLSAIAREGALEFRAPADARGLGIVLDLSGPVVVIADRHALRQALANLLANAVRLAPEGSKVTISTGVDGPWAWLAVSDEGPGIAPENQSRVFQRFFRGDEDDASSSGRSGLGLTIVRQIAESHGGTVRLVSQLGVGSTFAIWLPVGAPGG